MRENDEAGDKRWHVVNSDKGLFDLRRSPLDGPGDHGVTYVSFWVLSPRALDNLLLEPNVPKLDLKLQSRDGVGLWLNGRSFATSLEDGGTDIEASGLPLQQGWNHFLIRLRHTNGDDNFLAQLVSNQPDFLGEIKSATQKP